MNKVSKKYLERAHFLLKNVGLTADLHINLLKAELGKITGEIELLDKHLNFNKNVHGGTYFSLADTMGGLAVSTMGRICTTVNGTIHYLRPSAGCEKIICDANVIHKSNNMVWVETRIRNENNILLCTCELTYFLLGEIEY